MNNKEIFCKFCEKLVPQGKTKKKNCCNKKCYRKYYEASGKNKVAMDKYLSKEGVKIKNRERVKKYYWAHRKPTPPLFCDYCNRLLTGRKMKWCNQNCRQRKFAKPKPLLTPKEKKARVRAYEKEYWGRPENAERKRKKVRESYKRKHSEQNKTQDKIL